MKNKYGIEEQAYNEILNVFKNRRSKQSYIIWF